MFLPPEGEVLICLGGTLVRLCGNGLKYADLHGHIIYQNDPLVKPDLMDLYRRRHQRQARRRVPRHPPDPQKHFKNAFIMP